MGRRKGDAMTLGWGHSTENFIVVERIAHCQSPCRAMYFKVRPTVQSSQNMHVNKWYGLSSVVMDVFPQVKVRAIVKKIPLRSPAPEHLELLLSAGI